MKLSSYVSMQKDKGFSKQDTLVKAKKVVAKSGQRWTSGKQKIFDEAWASKTAKVTKTKVNAPVPVLKSPRQLEERGQGGTAEQRIKFLKTLLEPCKFMKDTWNKYGFHYIKPGSYKRPTQVKEALELLEKHGFVLQHRLPMSDAFSDRSSERAVSWYKDKYGNSANTVSQKSDNGKNDFYILNITPLLTNADRVKLSSVEQKLDEKYNSALIKVKQGKLKQKSKPEVYQMTLKEFTKSMKGTNSVRLSKITPEEYKAQWISEIEKALKAGLKLSPEVQAEYTSIIKTVGGIYKIPTGPKTYKPVTLDAESLNKLSRKFKKNTEVSIKSDDGTVFVLTKNPTGNPVGASFKTALQVYPLYAIQGKTRK